MAMHFDATIKSLGATVDLGMSVRRLPEQIEHWQGELLGPDFTSLAASPQAACPPDRPWCARWSKSKNCFYFYEEPEAAARTPPAAVWHLPGSARVKTWTGGPEGDEATAAAAAGAPVLRSRCVCGQLCLAAPAASAGKQAIRCHCQPCRRAGSCHAAVWLPVHGLRLPEALGAARTLRRRAFRCNHIGAAERLCCANCLSCVCIVPRAAPTAWDGEWDVRFPDSRGTIPALWRIRRPSVEYLNARVSHGVIDVHWGEQELSFALVLRDPPVGWGSRYDVVLKVPSADGQTVPGQQTITGGALHRKVEKFDLVRSASGPPPAPPLAYLPAGAVEEDSIPRDLAKVWREAPLDTCTEEAPRWWVKDPLCMGFQGFTGTVKGGCGCGRVSYEATLFPGELQHCYCALCRRLSGAALQTWVPCDNSRFRWTRQDTLVTRDTTPLGRRQGCSHCGSCFTILYKASPDKTWVAAGSWDDASVPRDIAGQLYRIAHICCGWMPRWHCLPADGNPRIRGPG
eukprot:TRINITY_DN50705_c0_g1_i1.p1 TRINITY_DN50705_c0_g1~~TRINITY_DN50705_c0_g1_i1.p1  ORF type:complete len:543 (+),score=123.04 TRINITY_DN50705_c0_g1_i1:89-1630(+)